jgi:hypothetical protein
MTAARRWWIVAVGVLLLVATPVLVRAIPVPDDDVGATTLLERVQASRDTSFTGYAETAGNLDLPSSEELSGVTKLLTGTNKVRVWWRDRRMWRTATLRTTGETDLFHRYGQTIRWVYELKNVTVSPDVAIRLPQTPDLLPNELGHRVLSGAHADELSRLPARRIGGRTALGLRLTPTDRQAAIGRVDVYVDRATAVPLWVEVFAKGSRTPAVVSHYVDFDPGRPSQRVLRFIPPADAHTDRERIVDIAAAANEFAERVPPDALAGLPKRPGIEVGPFGYPEHAVGLYGRGPTVLIAIPVWSRIAPRMRADLQHQPGVARLDQGLLLTAKPLRLMLAEPEPDGTSWLLAGTVTKEAIVDAATQLAQHRPGRGGLP